MTEQNSEAIYSHRSFLLHPQTEFVILPSIMKPLVVGFQEEDESKDHSHHHLCRKERSFEDLILLCSLYKGAFISKSSPVKQIP